MQTIVERSTIYKEFITLKAGVPFTKKIPAFKTETTEFIFLSDCEQENLKLKIVGFYTPTKSFIESECFLKLSIGEFNFKAQGLKCSLVDGLTLVSESDIKGYLCVVVKIERTFKPYLM